MYLNLGVCMLLKDFKITRIENVDFNSTVEEFKSKVAEEINFLKENIGKHYYFICDLNIRLSNVTGLLTELVFSGITLPDSSTLKDSGLREGYVVHVFQRKEKGIPFRSNEIMKIPFTCAM